ncbi:hypothetical protein [Streptomyces sp. NPDC002994]|uniref:hypothetical protein n=1 Tax=Streptomyces sp. NPDC002994 TaxID=3154441 RepID=UPI00339E70FD
MSTFSDPGGNKTPRGRLFRFTDTNRRDENPQRHGPMVHIQFIAIPALPLIVISVPTESRWETFALTLAAASAAAVGRLAWRFVSTRFKAS